MLHLKKDKLLSIILLLFISVMLTSCLTTGSINQEEIKLASTDLVYVNICDDTLGLYSTINKEFSKYDIKTIPVNDFSEIPATKKLETTGTGFFVSPNLLITNNHVITDHNSISYIKEGELIPLKILLNNEANDIAILKSDIPSQTYFKLSTPNSYQIADTIFVLGYPLPDILSSGIKVTTGIINSMSGINNNTNEIQISAQIQPGNSGGPVINQNYEVVGIASSKLADDYIIATKNTIAQNINFAIKADVASLFVKEFLSDEDSNYVTTMSDAINSTVQVITGKENLVSNHIYYIYFNYVYSWDAIHFTLSAVNMFCYDLTNEEMVKDFSKSYWVVNGAESIIKNHLNEIIREISKYENLNQEDLSNEQ